MLKKPLFIEIIFGFAVLIWSAVLLWLFVSGETTLIHDNVYWDFPLFKFFAEGILRGHLPLWNPFTHGGEPFYPLWVQNRCLEPFKILLIWTLGKFTHDSLLLFNLTRIFEHLACNFGVYLFLRLFAKHLITRIALIFVVALSSLWLAPFRQAGILYQFEWFGFVMFFLARALYFRRKFTDVLGLFLCLGLFWQSYWFTGAWTFLIFFSVGCAIFARPLLTKAIKYWYRQPATWAALAIAGLMATPNIVLLNEANHYRYPARTLNRPLYSKLLLPGSIGAEGQDLNGISGIVMPYEVVKATGTPALYSDFLRLVNAEKNPFLAVYPGTSFGVQSESVMYIGLIMLWFVALGICPSPKRRPVTGDTLRKPMLFCGVIFLFLVFGAYGGLHPLLYPILPTLWFVRNIHCWTPYLVMTLLFLATLGMERWLQNPSLIRPVTLPPRQFYKSIALLILTVGALVSAYSVLPHQQGRAAYALATFFIFAVATTRLLPSPNSAYALLSALVLTTTIVIPEPFWLLYYRILPFLFLPLFFSWLYYRYPHFSFKKIWPVLVVATLFFDLSVFYSKSFILYQSMPRLDSLLGVSLRTDDPYQAPTSRAVSEQSPMSPMFSQLIRYYSLLDRKSYVFSAPKPFFVKSALFEEVRRGIRVDTYLLPNAYYELIHSDYSDDILKRAFAVENEVVQFRDSLSVSAFSKPDGFSYELTSHRPEEVKLKIQSPGTGWVYFADGYDKQWEATLNGNRVDVAVAARAFKAVQVSAGAHEIIFTFRPVHFQIALLLFFGAFTLGSIAFCLGVFSSFLRTTRTELTQRTPPLREQENFAMSH